MLFKERFGKGEWVFKGKCEKYFEFEWFNIKLRFGIWEVIFKGGGMK